MGGVTGSQSVHDFCCLEPIASSESQQSGALGSRQFKLNLSIWGSGHSIFESRVLMLSWQVAVIHVEGNIRSASGLLREPSGGNPGE